MVRLTDRPDMTLDVYRGRKTTIQQQTTSNKLTSKAPKMEYTVKLQWLEHLWDYENMFETGVVGDNEC